MTWLRAIVVALLCAISVVASALIYNDRDFTSPLHVVIGVNVAAAALGTGIGMLIGYKKENLWTWLMTALGLIAAGVASIVVTVLIQHQGLASPPEVAHVAELILWGGTFVVFLIAAAIIENTVISDPNNEA